jgi:hypothetical protein
MGTFAETAIADYRYHLPTKENKCQFSFSFAANRRKFAVSVFHLQQTNRSCHFFKRKTEAQMISFLPLPFAQRTNRSLSIVRLLTKKQMEAIRLQTD